MRNSLSKSFVAALLAVLMPAMPLAAADQGSTTSRPWTKSSSGIQHVLMISIDGMHEIDFINCVNGIAGANGGLPYCPNLASLLPTGVNYMYNSTSQPSDSYPGLMALMTGGTPRTTGIYYDVSYDRALDAPAKTTGNGVAGGPCLPYGEPTGSTAEFDEGIDLSKNKLNGGAPAGVDGGIQSIDPQRLERDPAQGCAPVYPWNFVRVNTIMGVIHAAGGYTAWTDKHPAYSSISGPGDGTNLDDFYAPEINSIPVSLPGIFAGGVSCDPLPDQTAVASSNAWTDSFQNIECYDTLKVNSVINEINGLTHNGKASAPVPQIFGMNFQTVSVGEKLIETSLPTTVYGGYLDSTGTPSTSLLNEIEFTDYSIGKILAALQAKGLTSSTLVIIGAKHGQSPVDSSRYLGISTVTGDPVSTSPATIAANAGCMPYSESPLNPTGIGPTEDDVSMLWLNTSCTASSVVDMLETQSPATNNIAGIGQIFWGSAITQLFNAPGLPPTGDSRTPDILVTPNIGVTYSGSSKKQAEHGGFSHDDTNVMLIVSNPGLTPSTVTVPTTNTSVAPTILKVLGLNPSSLQAVQIQGTPVLPLF
jgi:hypothetical protein